MRNVVFQRPYRVPPAKEEEFLAAWQAFVTHCAGYEGFVRGEILRCLTDEAEWTHIHQIEVASLESLTDALKDPALRRLRDAIPFGGTAHAYEPVEFS